MKDRVSIRSDIMELVETMSNEQAGRFIKILLELKRWENIEVQEDLQLVVQQVQNDWNAEKKKKEKRSLINQENALKRRHKNKKPKTKKTVKKEENKVQLLWPDIIPWEEPKKYWNEDINLVMEMIAEVNWWAMNWSNWKNRQFANHLIKKIKAMDKVKDWTTKREDVLKMVILTNKDDPYNASKLSSPEAVYRDFGKLVASARIKIQEQQKKEKVNQDWVF